MNSLVVIPARLASSRLPEKLLLSDTGKSVIQYTHEAAKTATRPSGVVVATDSQRIVDAVERFGGDARLTDPNAQSGTDRVAEVAESFQDIDIFVNVQGDEPEIEGTLIDRLIDLLDSDQQAEVATMATRIRNPAQINDVSCVKVVATHTGRALYFSRLGIPFVRDSEGEHDRAEHYQHVGIYAYRREFLMRLKELPPSPLEESEKLEQLRFLQAGVIIRVGVADYAAPGIDTIEDYRAFVSRQSKR
jgi:3-deoxy-manno-octulosonate cytidylyltransferase (CMP-KDO synthetase)